MLLIIDNYDSFTYNIAHIFGSFGLDVRVYRNDHISPTDIRNMPVRGVVIGPGTMKPEKAGISCELIRQLDTYVPIFGIGLGHHCVAHVYGASFTTLSTPTHGKTISVSHNSTPLFQGLPSSFHATCYHTHVIDNKQLSSDLYVTAVDEHGHIMGLAHRELSVESVQFHPESILTRYGPTILANFARRLGFDVPQHKIKPILPKTMWPEWEASAMRPAL